MEWLDKIIGWLKIPLKILLPGLCIFSGFIMFASDNLIDKLYLKEFRQQTGFAFGLIFVITLSLILVYIIVFASKPYINKLKNLQNKRNLRKQIERLHGAEKLVLYGLYNEQNYAYVFPMNDPTINMLKARKYLFEFDQELDTYTYGTQVGVVYRLQPIVVDAITTIIENESKQIIKIQTKLEKCKDENLKKELTEELEQEKTYFNNIKSLSLEKYYGGEEQWIN